MGRIITVCFLKDGPSYMRTKYWDAELYKPEDRRFKATLCWRTDLTTFEPLDDTFNITINNNNSLSLNELFKWEE